MPLDLRHFAFPCGDRHAPHRVTSFRCGLESFRGLVGQLRQGVRLSSKFLAMLIKPTPDGFYTSVSSGPPYVGPATQIG